LGERNCNLGAKRDVVRFEKGRARVCERARRAPETKVGGAENLVLPHRQAAGELTEAFGECERCDPGVERVRASSLLDPRKRCFERRDTCCDPGETMCGALFGVDRTRREPLRERSLGGRLKGPRSGERISEIPLHS